MATMNMIMRATQRIIYLTACLAFLALGSNVQAQLSPRVYTVNYAATAPTIDGLLTSDNEWSLASEGGDSWSDWTTNSLDAANNRFVALWNNEGLYIQQQVDYQGWQDRGSEQWDSLYENLNFYFDPNVDNEANENTQLFSYSTDGYHLAINQPLGETEILADGTATAGSFGEFYVNSFYNSNVQPTWLPGIEMKQTTSVEDQTGIMELFIPWNSFDKTDPSSPDIDPLLDEIGLFHPEAPVEGEEWYFNAVRFQTNNQIAAWNRAPSAVFASERPHGILQFVGGGELNGCDMNGDGNCDGLDIDTLAVAVRDGDNNPLYDVDQDGSITDADRVFYIEEILHTWIGDSDLDGQFGTRDLVAVFVINAYEDGIDGNATWASGDWDGDLDFTTRDFVAAFVDGGFEAGPRAAVAAVPEPSSLVLLMLGFAVIGRRVRLI